MDERTISSHIAVIFDMDGVICHTNPYHSQAFRAFFSKRNLSPTDDDFALHMYGKSNSYILSHFLERVVEGEELLRLEDEKESLFRELYEPHIEPVAGFVPFIQDLHAHHAALGVATSAPRANLDLILGKVPVRDYFGSILASEHVKKHKPDPEVYLTSAQNLGVTPDQCVVFEDSFSGVTAALNAGMRVVGVLTSHTQEELPPCHLYVTDYLNIDFQTVQALF